MSAYDIIRRTIITEKTMAGISNKKYTFEVAIDAGKIEIAKAIEEIFNTKDSKEKVKVQKVNTVHVRGRERRRGRSVGRTKNWKKAYVTLTPDSKELEFFEGMM